MIGRITAGKCHLCKMNCPQENLAKSCAEGRMYATQEVVRLQKELEVYKAIGTPEECLRNKDFLDFLADKMNPGDFETYLHLYNALEEKGCEE